MNDLMGKRVIVTGAGKGIGRAICQRLHAEGTAITAIARTQADLDALANELGATTIRADLGKLDEARYAASIALPADLLVNCAGINILEPFLDMQVESYQAVMDVNLRAMMVMSQAYARHRIEQGGGGAIVNVSSLSAFKGFADHAAYCASKAGMDGMSRVMANELGKHGIRVNCVNPGVTLTALAAEAWSAPDKAAPMLSRTPLGRFAEVDEVADLVAFLLSDRSGMITGTSQLIEGGFSAV